MILQTVGHQEDCGTEIAVVNSDAHGQHTDGRSGVPSRIEFRTESQNQCQTFENHGQHDRCDLRLSVSKEFPSVHGNRRTRIFRN